MYLSLSEAAKEAGRSKSTIFKALKNGDLSYKDKTAAGYKIDPAELFRVFPRNASESFVNDDSKRLRTAEETPQTLPDSIENAVLKERVIALESRLKDKDEEIARLWKKLEEDASERRSLTAVIVDRRSDAEKASKKRRWFGVKS